MSLVIILKITYDNIANDSRIDQENLTKITANSVAASLRQYEVIIDIVGKELTLDNKYRNNQYALQQLDSLITVDESVASLLLLDQRGNVLISNSAVLEKARNLPNLFNIKQTGTSFEQAINSRSLVVGRTYYSDLVDSLIIPIRKAIRDQNGEVLFVVSLAVAIEQGFPFFVNDQSTNTDYSIFVYRDQDRYFQIAPRNKINDRKIYEYQFSEASVNSTIRTVEAVYGMSIDQIKAKRITTTHIVEGSGNGAQPSMLSNFYIKEYGLWVGIETHLEKLSFKFYESAAYFTSMFLFMYALIFWLFRIINKNEKRKKSLLTHQASHDFLTDLPNRFFLDSKFEKITRKKMFHLFFIDMDNFKAANDNYGHEFGDKVLIEISKRLKAAMPHKSAIVARYSGDEFIVIAFYLSNGEVHDLAKRLLETLSKPYIIQGNRLSLSASIGVANYPNDGQTFEEIKRLSDFALYESKTSKNNFTIFHDALKKKYVDHINLENKLREALNKDEIYMLYQPQIGNNGELIGLEALVRWQSPELGLVRPDEFIPVAESSGLMHELGNLIIKRSLNEAKQIIDTQPSCKSLSINISVKQFFYEGFLDYLLAQLDESGFDKNKLIIEITESLFIDNIEYVLDILNRLKMQGIRISLDDFGTGYSSLSMLKSLPIDELKIDKSFVDDIVENKHAESLLEGIISIAKKMGMSIVAEGIETKEQRNLLEGLGCEVYQGYYFSKPVNISDLQHVHLESETDQQRLSS